MLDGTRRFEAISSLSFRGGGVGGGGGGDTAGELGLTITAMALGFLYDSAPLGVINVASALYTT